MMTLRPKREYERRRPIKVTVDMLCAEPYPVKTPSLASGRFIVALSRYLKGRINRFCEHQNNVHLIIPPVWKLSRITGGSVPEVFTALELLSRKGYDIEVYNANLPVFVSCQQTVPVVIAPIKLNRMELLLQWVQQRWSKVPL